MSAWPHWIAAGAIVVSMARSMSDVELADEEPADRAAIIIGYVIIHALVARILWMGGFWRGGQ